MAAFVGPRTITDDTHVYHICSISGSFVPYFSGNIELLIVAGGGGGGMDMGGGGGGGGVLTYTSQAVTANTAYTVTVGAGGVGAPAGGAPFNNNWHQFYYAATQGGNSVFGSLTAIGGGFGGSSYNGSTPGANGGSGGSGGGASGYNSGQVGGAGTAGQGNRGGNNGGAHYSGGGGGAGAQGTDGSSRADGGNGKISNILGPSYYWGGGGGGAAYSLGTGGNGGLGGGGGGAVGITTGGGSSLNVGESGGYGVSGDWTGAPGGHGALSTGGGGGGGSHYNRNNSGGNGGSGIVIIKHLRSLGRSSFSYGDNQLSFGYNNSSLCLSLDAGNKQGNSVRAFIVAGGGGGGMDMGGGGGGGGVLDIKNLQLDVGKTYTVVVGGGGAGSTGPYGTAGPSSGSKGGDSSIGDRQVAVGGGGGGSGHYYTVVGQQGKSGGSGGGNSAAIYDNDVRPSGSGIRGQGYDGGTAGYGGSGSYAAGGGGGAGQRGSGGRYYGGGHGGPGRTSDMTGTMYYYGAGGGGSGWGNTGGNGGLGGGGGGSVAEGYTPGGGGGSGVNNGTGGLAGTNTNGGNAGVQTGSGGGGGTHAYSTGGAGGSGIVYIRYNGATKASGGSSIMTVGSDTLHTFTSSGTITINSWTGSRDLSPINNSVRNVSVVYDSANGGTYDYASGRYMIVEDHPSLDGFTQCTFEAWVNPTGAVYRRIFDKDWSTTFNFSLANDNSWYFYINGSYSTCTNTYVTNGVWQHLLATYDGSQAKFYYNGVLVQTNSFSAGVMGTNSTDLYVGSDTSGGQNMLGKMTLMKIYSKALTADEALQSFVTNRGRFGV